MVYLMVKFAKQQIYFDILARYSENFVEIDYVGFQLQPPRQQEFEFIAYAPINNDFILSDIIAFG